MFLEEGKGNFFDSSIITNIYISSFVSNIFTRHVFLFVCLLMSDVYATKIYFEMAQCLINKIKCFNR